jgi:hypothetical protein
MASNFLKLGNKSFNVHSVFEFKDEIYHSYLLFTFSEPPSLSLLLFYIEMRF